MLPVKVTLRPSGEGIPADRDPVIQTMITEKHVRINDGKLDDGAGIHTGAERRRTTGASTRKHS